MSYTSLRSTVNSYTEGNRLEPTILKNYSDVLSFYQFRDKCINGGKHTYSQATKTMRILLVLMNYYAKQHLRLVLRH